MKKILNGLKSSSIIDPAHPKNKSEKKLIGMLIAQEEQKHAEKEHHKISKTITGKTNKKLDHSGGVTEIPILKTTYEVQGKKIQLTNALVKFNDEYLVVKDKIGEGSLGHKVKVLPVVYKKDSSGQYVYQPLGKNNECVIKVCAPHLDHYSEEAPQQAWEKLKKSAQHEYEMLRASGDKNAGLFIDEDKQKVYIKSTKAPGLPLDKYLASNPDLPIQERLSLIHSINQAVLNLHAKNIYHLDLKLENIFFDPTTKKVTLIDFGSSIRLKPHEVSNPLGELTDDIELHVTTPFLEPSDKKQNSAGQIDSFSMAGVHGLILSDWSNAKGWPYKSVMQKKGKGYILFDTPEDRQYDFNSLKSETPSYIKDDADHKLLASVVDELNNLGHVDKEKRMYVQQFQTQITECFEITTPQQESSPDLPPTDLLDQVSIQSSLSSIVTKFKEIKQTLGRSLDKSKDEKDTKVELPKF
ncbi:MULTISPECIES: protein kinase domain-containing protein [Legionella]|uniref:Protein kinase n=1 Tax=Legionella resiliens TaxID=2905958 RepID=A0ABS8WZ25_9GAMM|nr:MULTISPECIES: lipopolysaccharide kinase InaA family protein [unclassified Legionella]MCE0721805.1 protein kinase [Legionella sp. 9fVS26]MCE3530959.1 protein kinase [Legionella sp. 8cVS16]